MFFLLARSVERVYQWIRSISSSFSRAKIASSRLFSVFFVRLIAPHFVYVLWMSSFNCRSSTRALHGRFQRSSTFQRFDLQNRFFCVQISSTLMRARDSHYTSLSCARSTSSLGKTRMKNDKLTSSQTRGETSRRILCVERVSRRARALARERKERPKNAKLIKFSTKMVFTFSLLFFFRQEMKWEREAGRTANTEVEILGDNCATSHTLKTFGFTCGAFRVTFFYTCQFQSVPVERVKICGQTKSQGRSEAEKERSWW